jgi:hypothetical protein
MDQGRFDDQRFARVGPGTTQGCETRSRQPQQQGGVDCAHWTREQLGIPGLVTAQVLALTRRWILPLTAIVVSAGLIPARMCVPSPRFPIAGRRLGDRSLIA